MMWPFYLMALVAIVSTVRVVTNTNPVHALLSLIVSLLAVAGILGWGVLTMARGGNYNIKNSNRIMRYRIIFQAIALIIILGLMWWRRTGS